AGTAPARGFRRRALSPSIRPEVPLMSATLLPRTGRWRPAVLVAVCACLAAGGCGAPVGDVSGKVTYQGKNLEYGNVTFISSNGTAHQADIQPDGSYSLKGVAPGPAKIAVVCVDPQMTEDLRKLAMAQRDPKTMGKGVRFDDTKYQKIPKTY